MAWLVGLIMLVAMARAVVVAESAPTSPPLFRTVDLNRGETRQVELADGTKVRVRLLKVEEFRDSLRSAVRDARVKVELNGRAITLHSGNAPFYKPHGDYDYVYVIDAHGWFLRYAHLKSIDPGVQPGKTVSMGQKIGVLGKEGSRGGWAHLHFDIKARQPSGKWGIQDAYAFLWEAYQRDYKPQLIAIARPHHLVVAGDKATLDGSRSWSSGGKIARYEWRPGHYIVRAEGKAQDWTRAVMHLQLRVEENTSVSK